MLTTKKSPSAGKAPTKKEFTARDLAKEVGLSSAAVVRRYLRAAQIQKPKDGWVWPDKAAAKSAIEAVKRAAKTPEVSPSTPVSAKRA